MDIKFYRSDNEELIFGENDNPIINMEGLIEIIDCTDNLDENNINIFNRIKRECITQYKFSQLKEKVVKRFVQSTQRKEEDIIDMMTDIINYSPDFFDNIIQFICSYCDAVSHSSVSSCINYLNDLKKGNKPLFTGDEEEIEFDNESTEDKKEEIEFNIESCDDYPNSEENISWDEEE